MELLGDKMFRACSFLLVAVITITLLLVFDRTQQLFVHSFLVAIGRLALHEKLPTVVKCENPLDFPDHFMFGVSTSAYQVEGAVDEDGKTPSTWDTFIRDHPENIADGSNANVASNSYHLYKDDIKAVNSVGVSFSIDNVCIA